MTVQAPFGGVTNFITYAIAEKCGEANEIAKQTTSQAFPAGWAILNKGERQRVEGSFEDLLERADIQDFRFHDLRHTFASWYMMNGGDLYELAKILGHSNIK